jgi:hypothetical protein
VARPRSGQHKLGTLVLDAADTVVWLDLPMRVWMPRLARRTARRLTGQERLWNDNRESLRSAFWGRESLFGYALVMYRKRRREWPTALAAYPVVRPQSPAAVEAWLANAGRPGPNAAAGPGGASCRRHSRAYRPRRCTASAAAPGSPLPPRRWRPPWRSCSSSA